MVHTRKDRPFLINMDKNESELENTEYKEGKIQVKYGIKFERNHYLRQKAIEIHGTTCKVCGFNFEKYTAVLERILLKFIILGRCILLEEKFQLTQRQI